MTSLYFDDATITDVRSAKGSGQWAMNQLCLMIGSPFAEDKKQTMQSTGTFLGLTHDLSSISKTGHVRFWARDRLHLGHGKRNWPLQPRHSLQAVRSGQLLGTRYLWPCGIWRPYGHQGTARREHHGHDPGD